MAHTPLLSFLELLNLHVSLLDQLISLGDAALGVPLPERKDRTVSLANGFLQGLDLRIMRPDSVAQPKVSVAYSPTKSGDFGIFIVDEFCLDERLGFERVYS